jgi:membrane dipeptidase
LHTHTRAAVVLALCAAAIPLSPWAAPAFGQDRDAARSAEARALAQELLIVDTHIDAPYRVLDGREDLSRRTDKGQFDFVRAREGGLDLPFMSIYTASSLEGTGKAKPKAEQLIAVVETLAATHPDKFVIVRSVADVERERSSGRIMLALGMENGSPVEHSLDNLRAFYRRGVRYLGLAHAKNNHLSDASYDKTRKWNGLSPFGKTVVQEMNRLGIMVDLSHLTDRAVDQVLALSTAPVIASHSSCRRFTPGFERNLGDEQIRALARKGGVVQINFGSEFLTDSAYSYDARKRRAVEEHAGAMGWGKESRKAKEYAKEYVRDHPFPHATVADVVDHFDHVIAIAGEDHVGLGSDFDGVGDSLPIGLKDVSMYPALIEEMLKRGYSRERIAKVCGGNLMRVWAAVESVARHGGTAP